MSRFKTITLASLCLTLLYPSVGCTFSIAQPATKETIKRTIDATQAVHDITDSNARSMSHVVVPGELLDAALAGKTLDIHGPGNKDINFSRTTFDSNGAKLSETTLTSNVSGPQTALIAGFAGIDAAKLGFADTQIGRVQTQETMVLNMVAQGFQQLHADLVPFINLAAQQYSNRINLQAAQATQPAAPDPKDLLIRELLARLQKRDPLKL